MKISDKIRLSAKLRIVERRGSYSKPSEIRALLRDPRFIITKRGAVKRKEEE